MTDAKLTTRCPHCDTAFRVYTEQLAARQGKVRCGACGNVFDAYETLEREDGEVLAIGHPRSLLPRETDLHVGEARAPAPVDLSLETAPGPPSTAAPPYSDSEIGPDYDFGPVAPSPRKRALGWAGAALLAIALVAQALYWFRGEIAARFPPLAPLASGLCNVLGCKVVLPRYAESIAIEASDLQSDPSGVLVLATTLRNKAGFTQALPSLELTLTDPREQPVVRKVLAPADYLGAGAASSGIAPGGEVVSRVYIDASAVNATGYRVFVFYP
jgi:predicted Zn finger-like uncharacterized protein